MRLNHAEDGSALVQASAVAVEGRAVLILGRPGSGKSNLALGLVDRGGILIGDDAVTLSKEDGSIIASPPPNIAGKLEIRGIGIVDLPTTNAPLALILKLDREPERLPETAGFEPILGCNIPELPFDAGAALAPLRAEWALKTHGLA